MMIAAFAFDYDGTLAHEGCVEHATSEALQRLKASGVKLLLVTGRELPDLQAAYPGHELFDVIVAENGALMYWPARREERLLTAAAPPALVQSLRRSGIKPLSIGRSIIATRRPNETHVLEAIRESKLEWHIVFNKDAVMALPSGVNKASGLAAALDALGLSPLNVFAVGDAENDHALLSACGYRAAVANAVEALKRSADIVTEARDGRGIVELIERFLHDPASGLSAQVRRHDLPLGRVQDGAGGPPDLQPDSLTLITGGSAGGKSRLAVLLMERIARHGAQLCVVDPEGDYERFEKVIQLGDAQQPPTIQEALQLLQKPGNNLVLNLMALELSVRPQFFTQLSAAVADLRARSGRPHWFVVDEAHHVIPASAQATMLASPRQLAGGILITSEPQSLSSAFLRAVRYVITVGSSALESLRAYCEAAQVPAPPIAAPPSSGHALVWDRDSSQPARTLPIEPPSHEHQRHIRKYAQGNLGEDKSFYFRGSSGALNLRAQNLTLFLQIAEGVDDGTWLYHLGRHDYSRWFNEAIKDQELASEARQLEDRLIGDALQSRRAMRELISRRYTAPAG